MMARKTNNAKRAFFTRVLLIASSRRLAIHSTRPALRCRKCLTSHDVRREGTRKGFADGSNSGKSLDQTVQACARLLSHGRKLDAHSFAGLAKAHQCAGAHVAARDFKNQLNYISGRGRLRGRDKQSPKRKNDGGGYFTLAQVLPGNDRAFRQRHARISPNFLFGKHKNLLSYIVIYSVLSKPNSTRKSVLRRTPPAHNNRVNILALVAARRGHPQIPNQKPGHPPLGVLMFYPYGHFWRDWVSIQLPLCVYATPY